MPCLGRRVQSIVPVWYYSEVSEDRQQPGMNTSFEEDISIDSGNHRHAFRVSTESFQHAVKLLFHLYRSGCEHSSGFIIQMLINSLSEEGWGFPNARHSWIRH